MSRAGSYHQASLFFLLTINMDPLFPKCAPSRITVSFPKAPVSHPGLLQEPLSASFAPHRGASAAAPSCGLTGACSQLQRMLLGTQGGMVRAMGQQPEQFQSMLTVKGRHKLS